MAQRMSISELLGLKRRMASVDTSSSGVPGRDTEVDEVKGDSLLDKVGKLAFQNAMCLPPSRAHSQRSPARPRRIAICLVIVDCLVHENVWRRWVDSSNEEFSAELYVHAKHPEAITSPWARQRTLSGTFLPEWNSIEVERHTDSLNLLLFHSYPPAASAGGARNAGSARRRSQGPQRM